MPGVLRIGTRDSQLAVWQATQVQNLLQQQGIQSELIFIKSEGDKDLITPLYALGVEGIFTKALDAALLNNRIDIAVHSMKDVPTQLAEGVCQAAVLKRGNWKDVLVVNGQQAFSSQLTAHSRQLTIATSSIRRIAQWLYCYPNTQFENLRGNVNTRLRKLNESTWNGAIFAAAGLERINLRPANAMDLDWMLPAPAQGAIVVVCRSEDEDVCKACQSFNDEATALCTKIEKDFLKVLMGGCSMPIGGLAVIDNDIINFRGNILSADGKEKIEVNKTVLINDAESVGTTAAQEILNKGGREIVELIRNAKH